MRISDEISRCVFFIGHADSRGGFSAAGTGFFVGHKKHRYLLTAQHIAHGIGDNPFAIRVNKNDGTSDNILIDPIADNMPWFVNVDEPDVDLAVMPFDYDLTSGGRTNLFLASDTFATADKRKEWNIGTGDVCYVIGLFRLMAGTKRNLPVVHQGSIALNTRG
jgi:hypothetical protein